MSEPNGPRILLLDLETTPNLAYVWGLFNQTISIKQIVESTEVICFGARWYGDQTVEIRSVHKDGKKKMLERIWELMDEADAIAGWNTKGFDVKHLNREFVENGMLPPSPHLDIDLMLKSKAVFRFPSNKLDYFVQKLGIGKKVQHEGFDLWVKCIAGDEEAWERMYEYQKQDVDLLVDVYEKLQPWIKNHPNHGLFNGKDVCCTNCGSENIQRRGFAYTGAGKFQRFQCNDCGRWSKSSKRTATTELRSA